MTNFSHPDINSRPKIFSRGKGVLTFEGNSDSFEQRRATDRELRDALDDGNRIECTDGNFIYCVVDGIPSLFRVTP